MKLKAMKAGKIGGIIFAVLVLALLVFNSFYTITEQEQAVVTTFGVPKSVTTAGLHLKIPFVQNVQKVNTTIQGLAIGYDENEETVENEGIMITSDYNFVDIDFYVEYRVSDPMKYLYGAKEPVSVLKNIAQSCIRTVIGNYDVDSVLTTGKSEIQTKIKTMIMENLEFYDIGLSLINITIQDSAPPTAEVMAKFKEVENAKQNMDTALNNAEQYQNEQKLAASASVDQILNEAEAQKTQRINEAKSEVAIFNATYEEYLKNPLITKKRMFYETMEDVLPNLKVIIDGTNQADTLIIDDISDMEGDLNQAAILGQQQNQSQETESQEESTQETESVQTGGNES